MTYTFHEMDDSTLSSSYDLLSSGLSSACFDSALLVSTEEAIAPAASTAAAGGAPPPSRTTRADDVQPADSLRDSHDDDDDIVDDTSSSSMPRSTSSLDPNLPPRSLPVSATLTDPSPPEGPPRTPPPLYSPTSPTLPASSSWPTPLSSSLGSLSSFSGPSSPGAGRGGGAGAGSGRRRRRAAAASGAPSTSSASASSSSDGAEGEGTRAGRDSNGELVLPMLPSTEQQLAGSGRRAGGGAAQQQQRQRSVLSSYPFASLDDDDPGQRPSQSSKRTLRLALVGAEEAGRMWLLGRLFDLLDLRAGGVGGGGVGGGGREWQTGEGGEMWGVGRRLAEEGGADGGGEEGEKIEVVMTLHEVGDSSTLHLASHIKHRHSPLLQQLLPLPNGLALGELVELAMTGFGRGEAGWVDCVLVLVDSERTQETLTAAAQLAPFAPTLLLALPSLVLPPLPPHPPAAGAHPPPFLNLSSSALPTTLAPAVALAKKEFPTLSLLALDPLRALLLGAAGRGVLEREAGRGFGRHLVGLLADAEVEAGGGRADDGVVGGGFGEAETDEELLSLSASTSSLAPSLYAYIRDPPRPSSSSDNLHSHRRQHNKPCRPGRLDDDEGPFDPLFFPATVRALVRRLSPSSSLSAAKTGSFGLVVLGTAAAAAAAAGLVFWSWLAVMRPTVAAAGGGSAASAWLAAFVSRIGVAC